MGGNLYTEIRLALEAIDRGGSTHNDTHGGTISRGQSGGLNRSGKPGIQ